MLAEQTTTSAADAQSRASFFRQSGWVMVTTLVAGACTWAVHFLARKTGPAEYGVFGTLLALTTFVPAAPLQVLLAQQTARALATQRQGELSGTIRFFWLGTFLVWLVAAIAMLGCQRWILLRWEIPHASALWVTLPALLFACWMPLFFGVLQGQQNFLWFGWGSIANAAGRIGIAALAVLAFGCGAAGMMAGVLVGLALAVLFALWQTRALWRAPSLPFDRRALLLQVLPLVLATAAFQFLFTADTMFVKCFFSSAETGFYVSAGTLSRALMWLVGPLAMVMFPRIVQSVARAEKTNLLGTVLLGTAVLSILGAVGLCLVGPLVVKMVFGKEFMAVAATVLPWYAGAMIPLTLGNVLLNNLLARSDFKFVPSLCVLAGAYGLVLSRFHSSLVLVLQLFGAFNLLFLLACAWYTWRPKPRQQSS